MKMKKFMCGVFAAACALSLAGADIALAQYGSCGRGQGGGGRGACMQNYGQSQALTRIIRARAGAGVVRAGSSACVTAAASITQILRHRPH
jgi:hypothetical protein